jgi:transcriptional regulator with XRE-family HTH domain
MPATTTNSLGVISLTMASMLHSATLLASEKCIFLREDQFSPLLHNARMDEIDSEAGSNLKAWRESIRMTQVELASKIGTTHAVISLLETGERKLSPKWLHKIAPVFGITAGWLLDHRPEDLPNDIREIWGAIPEAQLSIARDVLIAFKPEPSDLGKTGTDD